VLDLIIRGGDVIDGTGAPRRRADVGVKDGRIVAVGVVDGDADRTIDATGRVVTPGFVDVHTHFDAQIFWDGALTPSPLHGVTTVLAGNCGFTIAPLTDDAADSDYLMKMLARVEGMPLESLREGVPWSWRTTAEYLDALEGRVGVNVGMMVGHSAIRRAVMGGDANQRSATPEEVAAMSRLLHDGLDAGGIGFSSSWARTHNDAEGRMVPSRYATKDELVELCRVAGEHEGTSLEFLPMVGPFEPWAKELMADMSAAAQRPLNWNILVITTASAANVENQLSAGDVARERGGKVVALTIPKPPGVRLSLESGFVLDAMPGWETVMGLPHAYKKAILADPVARGELNAAAQVDHNPMRSLADWSTKRIFDVVAEENRPYVGRMLSEIAAEQGRDPFDVLCEIAVADDLLTSFGPDAPVSSAEEWKMRVDVWRDSRAVIGASDAGAHLDLLATFNYSTVLMAEAVREHGVLPLEEAVHLITDVPARLYGLVDRGRLEVGNHADIVVLDPATVDSEPIAMRTDLPGGAARLYADSHGIDHVLVNGTPLVVDGALTADRPGTVLRSGRDTRTPDMS
jgi:N-acyl-D-aspartate/D-glutamate deacylase